MAADLAGLISQHVQRHEARGEGNLALSQVWQPFLSDQALAELHVEGASIADKGSS